jgi:hypothetical protein
MPRGDAVQTRPSVADEMGKFKTFSVTNGETSDGAPTDEEKERLAANEDGAARLANKVGDGTDSANAQAAHNFKEQQITAGEVPEDADEEPEDVAGESETEKATRLADAASKKAARSSVQERINKATAKQRAAERELAKERDEKNRTIGALEARLAALEKGGLTKDAVATTKDPNAPRPEDYEFGELDANYVKALVRYEYKQELLADKAAQAKDRQTAQQSEAAAAFTKKFTAFEAAGIKKFGASFTEDVIESARAEEWPLPDTVGELIFDSPVGPEVAHYLANNPAEAERIAGLKPVAQAAAFGRLEAKFSSESPDATARTRAASGTQAPPVPRSRARGQGGSNQVAPDTSDFKAFEAMAMRRT